MAWSTPTQVFTHANGVASDPTLLQEGAELWCYYTGLKPSTSQTVLCLAKDWVNQDSPVDAEIAGSVLVPPTGYKYESAGVCKHNGTYYLWFTEYLAAVEFPRWIRTATSTDGITWTVHPDKAIEPTTGYLDQTGAQSPTVIRHNGYFIMLYTGYGTVGAASIIPAVSTDGFIWEKKLTAHGEFADWAALLGAPGASVAFDSSPSWNGQQAEPSLVKTATGFELVWAGIDGSDVVSIGYATNTYWNEGNYAITRSPVVTATPSTFYSSEANGPATLDGETVYFLGYDGTFFSIGSTTWS